MTRLALIACLSLVAALPALAEDVAEVDPEVAAETVPEVAGLGATPETAAPEATPETAAPESSVEPGPDWLPTRTEGDVRLTGALADEIAGQQVPRIAGYAMVCLLPARDAFLTIRAQPGAGGVELAEAPLFAALGLTGQLTTGHDWVEVDLVWLTHDTTGNRLAVDSAIPLRGWVPASALCRFRD